MSQKQPQSNEDPRLLIEPGDVDYLVGLAKLKGFSDPDVATLYVVAAVGISVDTEDPESEDSLREAAKQIDRMLYDEKKQRLVGFIPPIPMMRQ